MADQEQVERLKRSVGEWNQWREQQSRAWRLHLMEFYPREMGLDEIEWTVYPQVQGDLPWADLTAVSPKFWVDLSGADLRGADLYSANLYSANLSGADLSGANLQRANLTSAVLSNADLSRAILQRADLHRANLISANLSEAELSEAELSMANLCAANLSGADLEKANWTNATIGLTQFDRLDLRGVIGLETVLPLGPSTLGLDTIYLSHGQIPDSFLHRVGAPETFITTMRALVNSPFPIEFYSCFISYSHQNEDFARRLYADLQQEGVRCWFAPEDLKVGNKFRQHIDEAIHRQDKLLLLLSKHSIESNWVANEVEAALERENREQREVLFPIRLDDAVMQTSQAWAATLRRMRHIGNFTNWMDPLAYQSAFERLLRDLKQH